MQWEKGLALSYADQFFVEKCEDYYLITIVESDRFLLIPENAAKPENIPSDIVVLQKPLESVYLSSSSVFDLVREDGALDHVRFSGTKKEDLCITEAVEALEQGKMLYAGKYSKPDYELLIAQGCDLAIENTMIYHNPETKEKLESLGIPVLVETSSYESHPFGRMEWIKLYGLLFDHLEEAQDFFAEQIGSLEAVLQQENTGAKVAVFYVNSNGVINVKKTGDYVAKMVSLARGDYVPESKSQEENALSTMNMQMEDFYLAAIFLGGALAVSGFLLQTFFGNPIAGPYVLGISSGAKLTVALTLIFFLGRGVHIQSYGMMVAAFVGSLIAMGFVLLVSLRVQKMSLLIVCGIMIGYIASAVTDLVVNFADDSNIVNLHNWSMGSFSGMRWENVKALVWMVMLTCIVTFLFSKPIGAYQMGEAYARNMGVNIRFLRIMLILLSSLLSACVTAFAGPISFVGIAVPHLVKQMTKTAKPILLIPGCFLCGAVVTLFCDGIARSLFAPTEVSISSVTAVLLAPVVIIMMIRRNGRR